MLIRYVMRLRARYLFTLGLLSSFACDKKSGESTTPTEAASEPSEKPAEATPPAEPEGPYVPKELPLPNGIEAEVKVHIQGERVRSKKQDSYTWDATTSLVWKGSKQDAAYSIEQSEFAGWEGQLPKTFAHGPALILPHFNGWVIDDTGILQSVVNAEATRESFQAWEKKQKMKGWRDATQRKIMDRALSDDGLSGVGTDLWSTLYQVWWARPLKPGESFDFENPTPVPQVGEGTLNIKVKVSNLAEEDCGENNDRKCYRFELKSSPDEEQLKTLLEEAVLKAEKNAPKIESIKLESRYELLVDVATRLPLKVETSRTQESVYIMPKGKKDVASETQTMDLEFTYRAGLTAAK